MSRLLGVLRHQFAVCGADRHDEVLVVGGGPEDLDMLSACGFERIVMSNISDASLALDAEHLTLPDDRYDIVFAHAVLHHCRSPHTAVGEMVRVARRCAVFVEPNDSLALRTLGRLGYSFPYELAAVAYHERARGGMRDGPTPNYIYRWTGREVEKTVASYQPQRVFDVHPYPYWDFYVNEIDLLNRNESGVGALARRFGAHRLIALLHLAQGILNVVPAVRAQGNKFCCTVAKQGLQPWIEERDGQYYLKADAPT